LWGLWAQPGWGWQVGIWLFPFAKLTLHKQHKLCLLWGCIRLLMLCHGTDIVSMKKIWYKALLCCVNAQCDVQDFHGLGFNTDPNQCLQKVTHHKPKLTSTTYHAAAGYGLVCDETTQLVLTLLDQQQDGPTLESCICLSWFCRPAPLRVSPSQATGRSPPLILESLMLCWTSAPISS